MFHGVYVTKEYRKFGIFSKLFDKAYQLAKEDKNWNEILLFVDIDNKIVQSVYSKLGLQNSGCSFYKEDFLFPDHLKVQFKKLKNNIYKLLLKQRNYFWMHRRYKHF